MSKEHKTIQEKIMTRIDQDRMKMKPRTFFVIRSIAWILFSVLLLLVAIYLTSVIVFVLHRNGSWFLPGFGMWGIWLFLQSFPWIIAVLIVGLIFILEIFLKKTAAIYRRPLIYSLIGLFLFSGVVGYAVAKAPFQERLNRQAMEGHLPVMGGLYRSHFMQGQMKHQPFVGNIIALRKNEFDFSTLQDEQYVVTLTPDTRLPIRRELGVGELIMVMGEKNGDRITAFGVRPIKDWKNKKGIH